jgi:hypothetical protein
MPVSGALSNCRRLSGDRPEMIGSFQAANLAMELSEIGAKAPIGISLKLLTCTPRASDGVSRKQAQRPAGYFHSRPHQTRMIPATKAHMYETPALSEMKVSFQR